MTALETQINKIPQIDAGWYLERLFLYPENSWFFPTNGENEDYSVCKHLAQHHVVQEKTVPNWKDGSLYGVSHAFLYRSDLNYKGGSEPF